MDNNLEKLIQLAKADGGKFFVIDEKGEPILVIMPVEEYEKVLLKKLKDDIADIEDINRQITEIQKVQKEFDSDLRSEVIDPTFSFEQFSDHEELEEI